MIVVGSERIGTDEFLAVGRTAEIVAWMLTGGTLPVAEPLRRTMVGPEIDAHATPSVVTAATDRFDLSLLPAGAAVASPEFTRAAGRAARLLPAAIHDALVDFADHGDPSGALLLRGLPVGELRRHPTSLRAGGQGPDIRVRTPHRRPPVGSAGRLPARTRW